ncbi:MAG: heme-binding protein, partial [Vicinamibacteria bacterium]
MSAFRNAARAILIVSAVALHAPVAHAQPAKTIRVAFSVAETGFDPQVIPDNYSSMIAAAIFEP